MKTKKEVYVPPVLTKHELLRDITAAFSGGHGGGLKTALGILSAGLPRITRTATKTVSWVVIPCWNGQRITLDFAHFPG